MTFQADIEAGFRDMLEMAGTTVTYTPKNAPPLDDFKILRGMDWGEELPGADDFGLTDVVGILVSDVATVQTNDKLDIPSDPFAKDWRVIYAKLDKSRTMWLAAISQVE